MRYVITFAFGLSFIIIVMGATLHIQGNPNGSMVLTVGLVFTAIAVASTIAVIVRDRRRNKPDAETTLHLKDLPDTVEEAEAQLRRDEDMIV